MVKLLQFFCFFASILAVVNGSCWDGAGRVPMLRAGASCNTKTGEPGVCKLLTECGVYLEGLQKQTIEYSSILICSFIGQDEVVCCPNNDLPTLGHIPTEAPIRPKIRGGPLLSRKIRSKIVRPSVAACQKYSGPKLNYTILDGNYVARGEYPHMANLVYDKPALRCGGSLISERYVLTTAYCVINHRPKFVRLGVVEYNSTTEDGTKPVDMEINTITSHPLYKKSVHYNDIALIELKQDVKFSPFVYPACLHTDRSDIDPDVPLVVIGWGITNGRVIPSLSENLLKTNVSTVSIDKCNATHIDQYPEYDKYHIGLIDGQYCAYDREMKKDVCNGDGGSPLQLVSNKKDLSIVGVVSYGISCVNEIPTVYTRVAYYLDWIESIVWQAAA